MTVIRPRHGDARQNGRPPDPSTPDESAAMPADDPNDRLLRPLASDAFRDVIGHFASGVTVITTTVDGTLHGTTANAVTSLSLEPPMLLICMRRTSATGRAVAASGAFAVNILGDGDDELARRFAATGGDKFAGVRVAVGDHGQPLLLDALAQLVCRVTQTVDAATHVVFFASVHEATARPGHPLAYYRGKYWRLAFEQPAQ